MAISRVKLLAGVTADGSGGGHHMEEQARNQTFPIQVTGITTATVTLEGSFDDTAYDAISGGVFSGDACTTLNTAFPYIRATVSGYSAGTITVWMGR